VRVAGRNAHCGLENERQLLFAQFDMALHSIGPEVCASVPSAVGVTLYSIVAFSRRLSRHLSRLCLSSCFALPLALRSVTILILTVCHLR
jgi:hypothetical protein